MSHDMPCAHVWVANSGRGGVPDYRPNRQMWHGVKMHVACVKCRCRTWLSPEQWGRTAGRGAEGYTAGPQAETARGGRDAPAESGVSGVSTGRV